MLILSSVCLFVWTSYELLSLPLTPGKLNKYILALKKNSHHHMETEWKIGERESEANEKLREWHTSKLTWTQIETKDNNMKICRGGWSRVSGGEGGMVGNKGMRNKERSGQDGARGTSASPLWSGVRIISITHHTANSHSVFLPLSFSRLPPHFLVNVDFPLYFPRVCLVPFYKNQTYFNERLCPFILGII